MVHKLLGVSVIAGGVLIGVIIMFGIVIAISVLLIILGKNAKQRKELLREVLEQINLPSLERVFPVIDDDVVVKSRQAFDKYTDLKYYKENRSPEFIKNVIEQRNKVQLYLSKFLERNVYQDRPQYKYVENYLRNYVNRSSSYRIRVRYITSAGNNKGEKIYHVSSERIAEVESHPELLMTKTEFNKLQKEKTMQELENSKRALYQHVDEIIQFANESKDYLVVKAKEKELDELAQKLYSQTVNAIQKISTIGSAEWDLINKHITEAEQQIHQVVLEDQQLKEYYESQEFFNIKKTCDLLIQSQKEFNEYINEKADSISTLFGVRTARTETTYDDTYNYVRAYKKSISPFTAEVSAAVFGSAENEPISYVIKYFYPNKSQYPNQIEKLRMLLEELETLKEAKTIIENYKKDYALYIKDVPSYVLEKDEDGFYSRLGFAVIDESILNVEYRFTYTSNGGMAQRTFPVPMTEETISELIRQLEKRLTRDASVKEQRALMTPKLRTYIKERDHYTCCQCGNSVAEEPNLLLEIDHIIPVSKGGETKEDNLQTLCWKCNRNKGAKLI